MTSKGQVTIPKALRQQDLPTSGFGLLKNQRSPLPVDFDPARRIRQLNLPPRVVIPSAP